MNKLQNKVAIVTGAGQGVGRGIALALAKEGALVAVVGRTLSKCENTVKEIESAGGRALAVACNVSKQEDVEVAISQILEQCGKIDILVNNAHTSRPMVSIADITDKDMKLSMGSGLYGTLYFMQGCFPYLKNSRGSVINLGSSAGLRGDAGFGAYAAAKEGIRALTRVAAREWGEFGINVNVVCPFSDSPGIDYMIETNPEFIPQLTKDTVLGRLGSSENDVGRTVVFLASDDADYITGQTINVDGGICIAP